MLSKKPTETYRQSSFKIHMGEEYQCLSFITFRNLKKTYLWTLNVCCVSWVYPESCRDSTLRYICWSRYRKSLSTFC